MKQWILRSFHLLNVEESEERFSDHDQDSDGSVSWKEYMMEVSVVGVAEFRFRKYLIINSGV